MTDEPNETYIPIDVHVLNWPEDKQPEAILPTCATFTDQNTIVKLCQMDSFRKRVLIWVNGAGTVIFYHSQNAASAGSGGALINGPGAGLSGEPLELGITGELWCVLSGGTSVSMIEMRCHYGG